MDIPENWIHSPGIFPYPGNGDNRPLEKSLSRDSTHRSFFTIFARKILRVKLNHNNAQLTNEYMMNAAAKLIQVKDILSYPDWEKDFRDAEDAAVQGSMDFPQTLRRMKVKQKLFDGDRTHPRLIALDALLAKGLTYPGWQADIKQIENMHANVPYLARSDIGFNSRLKNLEYFQYLHEHLDSANEEDKYEEAPPVPRAISPTSSASSGKQDETANNPLGTCNICGDEPNSHAFIPCGHLATCEECASKVMRRDTRCPVCRGSALDAVRIFLTS